MYIIDVASMDFPDGAQRFNWCNCQTPAALAAGLQGLALGQTDFQSVNAPIADWTVSDQDLSLLPAAASTPATMVTSVESWFSMLPSWWPLAAIALAAWYFFFRKGRRR
jgi:hypothetical protein